MIKTCHVCFMDYDGDVCPQCGNQEFSVLASDYQQTIDELRADLARVTAERDRLREALVEIKSLTDELSLSRSGTSD